MTAHDDLATLRDALLEAGREIHAHSDHPERIDFAAVLAEIDKAIAAARRVEAEIARLEREQAEAQGDVGIWQESSGAYRERMVAAEAENARLGFAKAALADIANGRWNSAPSVPGWNGTKGNRANEYARYALRALLADQDGAASPFRAPEVESHEKTIWPYREDGAA